MHWIKLERSKLYIIQFKYDFNKYAEFNAINIRKSVLLVLENVDKPLLHLKEQ